MTGDISVSAGNRKLETTTEQSIVVACAATAVSSPPLFHTRSRSLSRGRSPAGLREKRRSLHLDTAATDVPVPKIPERFLLSHEDPLQHGRGHSPARRSLTLDTATASALRSTNTTNSLDTPLSGHRTRYRHGHHNSAVTTDLALRPTLSASSATTHTRQKSLPILANTSATRAILEDERTLAALTGKSATMQRARPEADADMFLQLAEDGAEEEGADADTVSLSARFEREQRAPTRSSWSHAHGSKRRLLLGSSDDQRPRTSGQIAGSAGLPARPSTRQVDTRRFSDRYRTPRNDGTESAGSAHQDDTVSVSGRSRSGRPARYSLATERSPMSPPSRLGERMRSPEMPSFGRRRPSSGQPSIKAYDNRQSALSGKLQESEGDSPGDSSEPKHSQPDSASVESNTAPSTVWDELDDLKSRIKKLELTGKMPSTSSAAVAASIEQAERPRTATTAPTTVDSSPPKIERKAESDAKAGAEDSKAGITNLANIHPTLHAALAKAKTLLNASLYRSLETTATDALQMAALTGSAGPQGTAYSAASIINGVTVSDRHLRRKADTMCRNLTDLCLALCDGKHESPSLTASPMSLEPPLKVRNLTQRGSRNSLGPRDLPSRTGSTRPMSRLEARRSSILGLQPSSLNPSSPQASADDRSASEHETTPSHSNQQHPRRYSRSRLAAPRPISGRYDDLSADEDPTVRPPSRAMTDFSALRSSKHHSPRDSHFNTLPSPSTSNRSPSLRDSLVARRANAASHDSNRGLGRVVSTSQRRFARESTPPVLVEEEGDEEEGGSVARRRITSLGAGQFSSRRAVELAAGRSASLSLRGRGVE